MPTTDAKRTPRCPECGDYKLCECDYVPACIRACDAIGASTEALEAGVLEAAVEALRLCICALDDEDLIGDYYGALQAARAVLAKLDT